MFLLVLTSLATATIDWDIESSMFMPWMNVSNSENGLLDLSGNNNDGVITGDVAFTNSSQDSFIFDGFTDYVVSPHDITSSGTTINLWFNTAVVGDYDRFVTASDTTNRIYFGFNDGKIWYRIGSLGDTEGDTSINTDEWYMVTLVWDNDDVQLYLNGIVDDTLQSTVFNNPTSNNLVWGTSQTYGSAYMYNGMMNSPAVLNKKLTSTEVLDLFNEGRTYNPYDVPPPVGTVSKTEEVITQLQPSDVTITSGTWQSVMSGDFSLDNTSNSSARVTFNALGQVQSGELGCRILIDYLYDYGSELNRSVTKNKYGALSVQTEIAELSNGSHHIDLQCRRASGVASKFVISDAVGINRFFFSEARDEPIAVRSDDFSDTLTSSYVALEQFDINISEEVMDSEHVKFLLSDVNVQYDYSSTGWLNTYIDINGTVSEVYSRYGSAGSTGSVGYSLSVDMNGYVNDTVTVTVYGKYSNSGAGSVSGNVVTRELILKQTEVNHSSESSHNYASNTYSVVSSQIIDVDSSSSINVRASAMVEAGLSSATEEVRFLLRINSTDGSEIVRSVGSINEPGVIMIQNLFDVSAGRYNIQLLAKDDESVGLGGSYVVRGVDLSSYIANKVVLVPNQINFTAYDYNNLSSIQNFSLESSAGGIFSTTNGVITLSPTINFCDYTYFSPSVYLNHTYLDHNCSNNLNGSMWQTDVSFEATELFTNDSLSNVSFYDFTNYSVADTVESWDVSGIGATSLGITWDGTYFYVSQNDDQTIYKYYENYTYTGTSYDISATTTGIRGLKYYDSKFYIADDASHKIFVFNEDFTLNNTITPTALHGSIVDLTIKNNIIYCPDNSDDLIYTYYINGTYINSYDISANTITARGIAHIGNYFYVVDTDQQEIDIYNIEFNYMSKSSYTSSTTQVYGLDFKDSSLYLSDNSADTILIFETAILDYR